MNPTLQAPLDQVIRQFKQNCLIQFDGALFRLTPEFLLQLRYYAQFEFGTVTLFDADELPVVLSVERCHVFRDLADEHLRKAVAEYQQQREKSDQQFQKLIEIQVLADEQTE